MFPFRTTKTRPRSLRTLMLAHELALLLLATVSVALAAIWGYLWYDFAQESMRISQMVEEAQQANSALYRQVKDVTRARLTEDPMAMDLYQRYTRRVKGHLTVLRRDAAGRDELYAVQRMDRAYRVVQQDMNKVFVNPYIVSRQVRMKLLDPEYEPELLGGFEEALSGLMELLTEQRRAWRERLGRYSRWAWVVIPAPILGAAVLVVLSRQSLQRRFVQPMRALMQGAQTISRGELTHRIAEQGAEEVAALAGGMNHMAGELAASRDALVEKERQAALGALVPVVGHNIRNPLASIRATAQVLDDLDTEAEWREAQRDIIDTVDRLERWVGALVSYLHPLKPQPRPTALGELVDAVVGLARRRAEQRGVGLQRRDAAGATRVRVDRDLMEQALSGLVLNAIEASPPGETVTVRTERDGRQAAVVIEDRGPGLPAHATPESFRPGRSSKPRGTGLGIPFAYKVCDAHGWGLTFAAPAGGGTAVRVTVPSTSLAQSAEP
ncbi:MAG: HAMP domain-containing protein [Gammaproteobacteria bacterium]|nr:HAMP domain-containing protein [Gammaproteobacteria bacterium]NIR59534.1 HAMP domain-containing protein [Gammaproteobacteria bacterium]